MGGGYLLPSVRDGVSIWRAFDAKMTNLVLVLLVAGKAFHCLLESVRTEHTQGLTESSNYKLF